MSHVVFNVICLSDLHIFEVNGPDYVFNNKYNEFFKRLNDICSIFIKLLHIHNVIGGVNEVMGLIYYSNKIIIQYVLQLSGILKKYNGANIFHRTTMWLRQMIIIVGDIAQVFKKGINMHLISQNHCL